MKFTAFSGLLLVLATIYASQLHVEAASMDAIKAAAKTIANTAADKADQVEPVKEEGGVMQTVLHKTASMAMDKGVEVLAAKYPIVKVIAPQIKKFSKPVMNAAHSKINKMFNKDDETEAGTTPAAEEKAVEEKAVEEEEAPKETEADEEAVEEKENDKPSLMDKFKKAVGMEKEKEKEKGEEGEKEAAEEKEVSQHDKKRKEAEQSDEPAPKKSRKSE